MRDAFFRDYRCLVLSDCTAEVVGSDLVRTNHEASLLVIEDLFGWVAESESLLRVLTQVSVVCAALGAVTTTVQLGLRGSARVSRRRYIALGRLSPSHQCLHAPARVKGDLRSSPSGKPLTRALEIKDLDLRVLTVARRPR